MSDLQSRRGKGGRRSTWTAEADATLREMWGRSAFNDEIGAATGRSKLAIFRRARDLGLPPRSPDTRARAIRAFYASDRGRELSARNRISLADRRASFEEQVYPEPNSGCWLWGGAADPKGYGIVGGSNLRAHRVALLLTGVDIPKGMCVCHRCDMPACCNPDHLFIGTIRENIQDAWRKGRLAFQVDREAFGAAVSRGKIQANTERRRGQMSLEKDFGF